MKKLNFEIIIVLLMIIMSCSDDETPTTNPFECNVIESGKITNLNGDTIGYLHKFIYKNNLLIKRINYGNILSSSIGVYIHGEISRDSLVYDNADRCIKIYQTPLSDNFSYSEFIYSSNSPLPSFRLEHHYYDNSFLYTNKEQIFYEDGKIKRTLMNFNDFGIEFTKTVQYEYNQNNNLIKITETLTENENEYVKETTYSNYDNEKNPFINFPLLDYRGISNSPNNFKEYLIVNYRNGTLDSTIYGSYDFEYNEYGYPKIGNYECN